MYQTGSGCATVKGDLDGEYQKLLDEIAQMPDVVQVLMSASQRDGQVLYAAWAVFRSQRLEIVKRGSSDLSVLAELHKAIIDKGNS